MWIPASFASPDVPRVSPVEASARYLRHFVESWNHAMARDNPAHRLEQLPVVLTVPASFDDVARTLTVEAAACFFWQAGSPSTRVATALPPSPKCCPSACRAKKPGLATSPKPN